jgi:hypothetical protein
MTDDLSPEQRRAILRAIRKVQKFVEPRRTEVIDRVLAELDDPQAPRHLTKRAGVLWQIAIFFEVVLEMLEADS